MTKVELINQVAEKAGLSKKDAEKAVSAVVASISDALVNGEKVQLVGFGTFEVRDRKAKEGINHLTKTKITVPEKKGPAFKAGKSLKDAVAK